MTRPTRRFYGAALVIAVGAMFASMFLPVFTGPDTVVPGYQLFAAALFAMARLFSDTAGLSVKVSAMLMLLALAANILAPLAAALALAGRASKIATIGALAALAAAMFLILTWLPQHGLQVAYGALLWCGSVITLCVVAFLHSARS